MSSSYPCLSVVIPFHGRFEQVNEAARSASGFGDPRIEVLLVDDASSPRAQLSDFDVSELSNIRLLRTEKNLGGGGARNLAIDAARGAWIAFLDSDDVWPPDGWQIRLKLCEELGDETVAIYGQASVVGISEARTLPIRGPDKGGLIAKYLFVQHGLIQTSTLMVPASVAKTVRFDDGLRKHQDLDFCLRLEEAGVGFKFLEQPFAEWRIDFRPDRTTLRVAPEESLLWIRRWKHRVPFRCRMGFVAHQIVPQWLRSGRLLIPIGALVLSSIVFAVSPLDVARIMKWGVKSRCRP